MAGELHARGAMRCMLFVVLVAGVLAVSGCAADPEAIDPGAIVRANTGAVRCSADEGGNLHVRAPADARVSVPSDAEDPTVEVAYAAADDTAQMPRPRRPASRSLGFIGDGPLTQGPNHGGRYSYGAHDNLLPPHAHHANWGSSAFRYGGGYGSYGRGYGYSGYGPRYGPR